MRKFLGAIILGAALMAACGGGGKADTVPTNAPNLAESPTTRANATETSGKATAAPAPTDAPVPDAAKLKPLLLTLDDMPSGYSAKAPSDSSTGDTQICNEPDFTTALKPTGKAEADFQASEFGPILSQTIASYSSSDAKKAMDAVKTALSACKGWTETDTDGTKTTWTISALSFPSVGDQTFSARLATKDVPLFGSLQADFVFFRRGDVIESVIYLTIGPANTDSPLEGLAKKADTKIPLLFR